MGNWKLKGCPRCDGDLSVNDAEYGMVENCLQCGYLHYIENEVNLKVQNTVFDKEPVTVER